MANRITPQEYKEFTAATKERRIEWFRDARFGMFIHYGLFSSHGLGEWAQVWEDIKISDYEKFASDFCPREGCTDEWCRLAKEMGAKYAVLTTRHHEGFSLWDSKVNPFNSVNYGPHRDIVREFTDSCRKYGLKIGLYSSLMDWRHPDAWKCMTDEDARLRFTKYIEDLNTELLTNYGKIDILWYDMPWPRMSSKNWDSVGRNYRLRQLQPDILINNRSRMAEDFFTPEDALNPEENADWEACMTFNGTGKALFLYRERNRSYASKMLCDGRQSASQHRPEGRRLRSCGSNRALEEGRRMACAKRGSGLR